MKKILEKLGLLKTRFKRRLKLQQKHYSKWQRFKGRGKRGDKARAAYHLKRFKAHRKAVAKLVALTKEQKLELKEWKRLRYIPRASGEGDWAGSESVAREIEALVTKKRGDVTGSQKRAASDPLSIANPGSDHNAANTTAYAIDFLLANDYEMASMIAAHFDVDWAGDYSDFYVVRGGHTFRIQIIAGQHGTGPHLHVGIRRV